ncbi:restriction endonuclease subunit S [Pontimicrobium sp. MEBiC06410]
MKKLKQYPEYYDSEVEWLRNVPSHWEVVKSKRIFIEASIKGFPNEELLAATQTKGVIPKSLYGNTTVTATKNFETLKLVEKGDFVISLRSFQGGIEYAHYRGIISPAYTILKPQEEVVHKYYRYLLKSKRYISGLTLLVTGIREGQNIDTSKFKDSYLPLPPKQEQTTIANFLDYKTEKINRFINKKKQLIELLNEQKAAIINQAVTKGINPNVPMKDSGIEWLGEIPEHWKTTKLIGVSNFVRGNSSFKKDELLSNGNYVALQYGKTYKIDEVDKNFQFYVNDEFYKDSQVVNKGDVIIVSTSETIEDLGHSAFYNRTDIGLLGGEQMLLKPNKKIDGKYLYYSSKVFTKELRKYSTGVKVFRFNINDLKTIYTSIPPIEEQIKISEYIQSELNTVTKTITTIEKEITLVEEYKTALIAEAVTGKIDVRDFKLPTEETPLAMVAEEASNYKKEVN